LREHVIVNLRTPNASAWGVCQEVNPSIVEDVIEDLFDEKIDTSKPIIEGVLKLGSQKFKMILVSTSKYFPETIKQIHKLKLYNILS
jgi:hypothetical protein